MNAFNWWSVFGLSLAVTLLSALSASYERRAKSWNVLCSRAMPPRVLYVSKWAVLAIQVLAATVVFVVWAVSINYFLVNPHGPLAVGSLLAGIVLVWVTALPQLSIMLCVATRTGIGVTVILGLIGAFLAPVGESPYWGVSPWAWPGRVLMPIFGFHINGLPLPSESPFLNPNVIPGPLILSIVATALFVVLGAVWFDRREVR